MSTPLLYAWPFVSCIMDRDFTGRTELEALIDYEQGIQQEMEHTRANPMPGRAVNMVAILQSDLDVCQAEIRRLRLRARLSGE